MYLASWTKVEMGGIMQEQRQKKKEALACNAELLLLVMHLAVLVDTIIPEHANTVINQS